MKFIVVIDQYGDTELTTSNINAIKDLVHNNDEYNFIYIGDDKVSEMYSLGMFDTPTGNFSIYPYTSFGISLTNENGRHRVTTGFWTHKNHVELQNYPYMLGNIIIHEMHFALRSNFELHGG